MTGGAAEAALVALGLKIAERAIEAIRNGKGLREISLAEVISEDEVAQAKRLAHIAVAKTRTRKTTEVE